MGALRLERCFLRMLAEEILFGNRRRLRGPYVLPSEEEDESPCVGLLQVEAA